MMKTVTLNDYHIRLLFVILAGSLEGALADLEKGGPSGFSVEALNIFCAQLRTILEALDEALEGPENV